MYTLLELQFLSFQSPAHSEQFNFPHAIKATNPPAKTANPNAAPTSLPSLLPTPAEALVVAALALELVLLAPCLERVLVPTTSLVVGVPAAVLAPLLSLPAVFVASPEAEEGMLVAVVLAAPEVCLPSVFVDAAAEGEMVERTPPCIAAGADTFITCWAAAA
jgi:hypothetical protein